MARVLIVDDAAFMRSMLKKVVESLGHTVVGEADSGDSGAEQYRILKPEIVTMDITMPNSDGFDGITGIMEYDKKAKIIVVSAVGKESNVLKAITLGAKSFIVKPFKPDKVKEEFDKILKLK